MKQRLEYIDAMRGFTMLLVVFSHIIVYGYHTEGLYTFNHIFKYFRMPLFFFVSGFIMYKPIEWWTIGNIKKFLSKKFMVQIVPTAIFLLIYLYKTDSICMESFGSAKAGYWFTLALFTFFFFYSVLIYISNKCIRSNALQDVLLVGVALCSAFVYPFIPNIYVGGGI